MGTKQRKGIVVGIDLAGSPRRNTGVCAMQGMTVVSCRTLHSDDEIRAFIEAAGPVLVAIDAPLSLPPGRRTIEDRRGGHFRSCDRELMHRGIRFFPITLGPMRMLTRRGIRWRRILEKKGIDVIEVYPGAAQDLWGTGRKQDGLRKLRKGLERLGIRGLPEQMNGDELDAATAAHVAGLHLRGRTDALGDLREGVIVLPRVRK